MKARSAITIKAGPDEVYAVWRDLERLPMFMYHLESVQTTGDGRSQWVAKGPGGRTVQWDAELTEDVPGEVIAWRSIGQAQVQNSGTVRFRPAPRNQGTEVHVELEYGLPGGSLGVIVAKVFGEEPGQQIRDDLRRLKQIIETGEVVRSEGSPLGARVQNLARQHPARPLEDAETRDVELQEVHA
jgi:uncharacterized membrane protein